MFYLIAYMAEFWYAGKNIIHTTFYFRCSILIIKSGLVNNCKVANLSTISILQPGFKLLLLSESKLFQNKFLQNITTKNTKGKNRKKQKEPSNFKKFDLFDNLNTVNIFMIQASQSESNDFF